MTFKSATINLDTNVIAMLEQFGQIVEFDMNEYKNGLPKYAEEQFEAMHFVRQFDNNMVFEAR